MRIVFFSNYLSPHQRPFSEEMFKLMGGNYIFVSCEPFSVSRKNMGWGQSEKQPYELRPYESKTDYDRAMELAEISDVMLWGSTKYEFIKTRIKSGRICIRYSERLFKKGFISSIVSLDLLRQIKFNFATRTKSSYLFCASAFSPFDFLVSLGRFKQMYKWGYYPKTLYYDVDKLMNKKSESEKISILWAGRMLKLKHPEIAIYLADSLKKRGIKFSMKIIGSGELEQYIKKSIYSKQLSEHIEMLGSMSPEEVRKHMENSDFFLFSSDFNEGWGAVLNESMNSGCVVMCSEEVGSAPYLIDHGKNGFLFNRKHLDELVEIVISLANNPVRRRELGIKAYETIAKLWSEKIAAERFCTWAHRIISNEDVVFQEGPMSQAELVAPKRSWWIR